VSGSRCASGTRGWPWSGRGWRARGRADHVAALARRWVLDGLGRALAVAQSVKCGGKGNRLWKQSGTLYTWLPLATSGLCFCSTFSLGFGVSFTATVEYTLLDDDSRQPRLLFAKNKLTYEWVQTPEFWPTFLFCYDLWQCKLGHSSASNMHTADNTSIKHPLGRNWQLSTTLVHLTVCSF